MSQYRVEQGKVFKLTEDGQAYLYDGSFLQYGARNLSEYLKFKEERELYEQ
jgi:hypothetical protein